MEYVEGKNLQALVLEAGPLHYAQACHYIAQAAEGLQHAHEKGFIHRDIKPANLILAKDGTVKILDMGLARSFHDDVDNLTDQLGDKMVVGSVDFMSPEQACGQPVDERSDIYGLGATLYALITGHPPFKGETTQVLMQHQMAPLPQLSKKLRGTVPPALYDLLAKMMAKNKGDRPRLCADVIEALSPWLPAPTSGTAVHDALSTRESKSTGASTTRSRSRRRRRKTETSSPSRATKLWIGGGVGVLALLMIFLAIWGFGGKDAKPTNPAGMPPANPEDTPFTQLIQVGTGGALSVAESTDQSPDRAVIAPANEKDPAQHWKFLEIGPHYKVVNRKTGKVLDVFEESTEEGGQIILWMNKTGNADNQLWRWDEQGPERRLLTKQTGMALDIDADGKAVQRRVDVNAKQRWRVIVLK
jgi:serine/threonine protein kinase